MNYSERRNSEGRKPIEFDASRRAIALTEKYGILQTSEMGYCKKVLSAAAMTYVATTAVSVLQLLRYISINRD
ncbi:MAG TPA: zinc metallopeptidase [Lachnospiraceae bacterium]|nr:zinc metallopeptidase [Lachnospiraceae bacterium]